MAYCSIRYLITTVRPPINYCVSCFKKSVIEEAGERWHLRPPCKKSKAIWPVILERRICILLSLSRSEIRTSEGKLNI